MKEEKSLLALRADPKKFQLVRHGLEAVLGGDALLDFVAENIPQSPRLPNSACRPDDGDGRRRLRRRVQTAPRRRQNQTASPSPFSRAGAWSGKSSPGRNRPLGMRGENFLVRQRMRMLPQNFQDRRARAGDFARLPAQTAGQRGQFLPLVRMCVRVRFHCSSKIAPDDSEIKSIANRSQN